ncbi:hypothetical protein N9Z87_02070 [Amylibacter sp.]|nr:hypothetical protein [Amylibacter sp.]
MKKSQAEIRLEDNQVLVLTCITVAGWIVLAALTTGVVKLLTAVF